MNHRFLPEARIESITQAEFYESQHEGLGLAFLEELEKAVNQVCSNPRAYPVVAEDLRRYLLVRFSHSLLYALNDKELLIVAVMHTRQRPGYWKDRVR